MCKKKSSLAVMAIVGVGAALIQGQVQDSAPASSNVRGVQTPRVFTDRSVLFTFKASDAKMVEVTGGDGLGKGPFPMTRDANGVWSVKIPPAVPGFHYYWFSVDGGVQVNDPGSEAYFGYGKATSGIEVPESGVDFYAVKQVPHGETREKWYFSKTTGEWRRCFVYTPPDYDKKQATRYPVLILQHGSGEDETGWTRQGKANFILDNLISEGKTKPMIVVMDRGYATRAGTPLPVGPSAPLASDAFAAFQDVMINDLIPVIDTSYRTIPDKAHRAMAGLSMGGMQTLFITLHRPELFAYIGSFSGPIMPGLNADAFDGALANPQEFNSRVKLLWLGVGTEEKQFRDGIKNAADNLRRAGVRVTYFESQGTAHEWQTWRRDLLEFLPKLFQ